jgi:hypothetical protein
MRFMFLNDKQYDREIFPNKRPPQNFENAQATKGGGVALLIHDFGLVQ